MVAAVDEVTSKTTAAAKATSTFRNELEGLAAGPLAKVGKFGLLGGLGIAGESVDQYMKYQKAMTQLVTQAGLPAQESPRRDHAGWSGYW